MFRRAAVPVTLSRVVPACLVRGAGCGLQVPANFLGAATTSVSQTACMSVTPVLHQKPKTTHVGGQGDSQPQGGVTDWSGKDEALQQRLEDKDTLLEAKDKLLAVLQQRVEELLEEKQQRLVECHNIIDSLQQRLGLLNIRESVATLITSTYSEVQDHIRAFNAKTPPPHANTPVTPPGTTGQEEYICLNASFLLNKYGSLLSKKATAVLHIYKNTPHCISKLLSKWHHTQAYLPPAKLREAVCQHTQGQDQVILLGLVNVLKDNMPNLPGEVYVTVEIGGTNLTPIDVAHILHKEGLPKTVNGLKKAVLKQLPVALKGKAISHLSVYLPEDSTKTTPCPGSTDLVERKEENPYLVTVK